jgi:F0F1-type ATP synthase delta subunit
VKTSRSILAKIIADKTKSMPEHKLAKEVAAYMLSEGRINELDALLRDIMAIRADNGLVEASVVSAHSLNAALTSQVSKLIKKLSPGAKKIIINQQTDPEIIGGLKISTPNQQLDISLKGKLNRFKQLVNEGIN